MRTELKQLTRQQELIAIDERLAEIQKIIQLVSFEAMHLEERRSKLCDISVLDYDCPHRRAGETKQGIAIDTGYSAKFQKIADWMNE